MRSTKSPSWIERALGIAPIPPPPHVFALDSRELRYGAFHTGPQGFVFDTFKSIPVPDDCLGTAVLGGPLRDVKAFWELLQNLLGDLGPIPEATLVLPDSWLRLTFAETEALPRRRKMREEMIRFKLKRLVPFRVDELRVAATEVTPYPEHELPVRVMLGFGIEALLKQLEDAFQAVGITLGRVTNSTLAVLAGVDHQIDDGDLMALVNVQADAFTVTYVRDAEPLLYRFKAVGEDGLGQVLGSAVRRDLRLTLRFMAQHFPDLPLRRCLFAASEENEGQWSEWISSELGVSAEPLGFEHFQLSRTQVGPSWMDTAPLVGAACIEVPW